MRYWALTIVAAFVLVLACNDKKDKTTPEPSTSKFLVPVDTSRWLGTYIGKDGGLFYDVVFLWRTRVATFGKDGNAVSVLDSTFFIPIKTVDSSRRNPDGTYRDSTEFVSAPKGTVRIMENFDTSVKRLQEWLQAHKK